MNRIDRLVAILVFLQSKRLVTANDVAERFSISLRTVYRDVKALIDSGVPVIGEAGRGYSIEAGYHLPPVMFSREEAAAMLTAGKLIENLSDASLEKQYGLAMEKVKAVIRYTDKEFIEVLDNHIHVFQPPSLKSDNTPDVFLAIIQKAMYNKHILNIEYAGVNSKETTRRKIEPIGMCFYSSRWHLLGYCHLRKEYRDFRLDRLIQLVETEESFTTTHPSVKEYYSLTKSNKGLFQVTVLFPVEVAKSIGEQRYFFGFLQEEDKNGQKELTFLSNSIEWMGNWLLGFGNKVQVEEPVELIEFIRTKVKELSEHYY